MSASDSKPRGPHRALVWILIVLASVVLVLSLTANWIQRELFNTDEVANTTDEILKDEDVQEALATYAVDQLYANVDVQEEVAGRLPSGAEALAVTASRLGDIDLLVSDAVMPGMAGLELARQLRLEPKQGTSNFHLSCAFESCQSKHLTGTDAKTHGIECCNT